jgi:chromosomal replication initiation ATPase DnaA
MPSALEEEVARVAEAFRVDAAAMLRIAEPSRRRPLRECWARGVAMWLVRERWRPRPSLGEIAAMFGMSEASSVKSSIGVVLRHIERGTDVGQLALLLARPSSAPPRLRVLP